MLFVLYMIFFGTQMKTSLLSKDQNMLLWSGQKSDLSEDGFVGIKVAPLWKQIINNRKAETIFISMRNCHGSDYEIINV